MVTSTCLELGICCDILRYRNFFGLQLIPDVGFNQRKQERGIHMKSIITSLIIMAIFLVESISASEVLVYALKEKIKHTEKRPEVSTTLFSFDPRTKMKNVIFTDKESEFHIAHHYGGSSYSTDAWIAPNGDNLYARMIEPKHKISTCPGVLYRINRDRSIEKLFRFEFPYVDLCISNDGKYAAYLSKNIVVRDLTSGKINETLVVPEIDLNYVWLRGWRSDDKALLIAIEPGDVHITPENIYEKKGLYWITRSKPERLIALTGKIFKEKVLLKDGYSTAYETIQTVKKTGFIGVARKYEKGVSSPVGKLFTIDHDGGSLSEIPLKYKEHPFYVRVSPTTSFIAYNSSVLYAKYESMITICIYDSRLKDSIRIEKEKKNTPSYISDLDIVGWLKR